LRGVDLNHRPLGYEPNELPDCSTPQFDHSNRTVRRQTASEVAREGVALALFGVDEPREASFLIGEASLFDKVQEVGRRIAA
jgi:hypothetical protein